LAQISRQPWKASESKEDFSWWENIQNGFLGVQNPTPLIRCKSLSTKKQQLFDQTYGTLNSMIAIDQNERCLPLKHETSFNECIEKFIRLAGRNGKNEFELGVDILNKRAKYHRHIQKMSDVQRTREELGHPTNLSIDKIRQEQQEREKKMEKTSRLRNQSTSQNYAGNNHRPCREARL
jgi:hypothetical protein